MKAADTTAFGFGVSYAAGYPLADDDVEALAKRIGVPATQVLRNNVQRAVFPFIDLTMMGLGVVDHPYNVCNRVMWTISESPGEALRLIIAAVGPESEREHEISAAEAHTVYAFLKTEGIDIARLKRDGVMETITVQQALCDDGAGTDRASSSPVGAPPR